MSTSPKKLDGPARILSPSSIQMGGKYGRLKIIGPPFRVRRDSGKPLVKVVCECGCGSVCCSDANSILSGNVHSCGCLEAESRIAKATRHGYASRSGKHPLYNTWRTMCDRCHDPNNHKYKTYGARGIAVCDEWRTNPRAFIEWGLANGWQPGLTIDRVDNDGNYEPANCQFLTRSENSRKRFADKRKKEFVA